MRTHYGPWQPCWISNQHQKHKSGREPSSEHFWQVWLKSVQRFQRRRFKCEKLTDGRMTDAYPWQKLTWPMARWAKNGVWFSLWGLMKNLTIFWMRDILFFYETRIDFFFFFFQFDRFLPSDTVTMATVYAPIMFPPSPVLVYKETYSGVKF